MIPFLVNYSTTFDSCLGGSAVVYAEDFEEARIKSDNYCYDRVFEEIVDDEGYDIVVDIDIVEFNNLTDGDIRDYEVIEYP